MRLALLSNVTINLLASTLKKKYDIYIAPGYDTWQQEVMDTQSGLYKFKPQSVVLLLYADAYPDIWNSQENGIQLIKEWINSIKILSSNLSGIPIFVSSIDITSECQSGAEKRLDTYFENYFKENIETLHDNSLRNIYLLPVAEAAYDIGRNQFYSPKMWYLGSMPFSLKGLSAIEDLITHYTDNISGSKKKCLVLDLDNTLWGGVIGEDGVEGIILSNYKEGAIYKDTQRLLKKMKNLGVMLAIISKNNPKDVEPVFNHPDMILHQEDFVAEIINWKTKTENVRYLAKSLNIGLDSFVFLDDNPAEREQMMVECPEVTVIDFPGDISYLPETIKNIYFDYFFSLEVTQDDIKKTDMYIAQSKRDAERNSYTTADEFLSRLHMELDIHLMTKEEEQRVTQLINKTNQFNVTTKRYTAVDVHSLAANQDDDIITVHMSDKYGDQGLVAVIILKYDMNIATANIDTFLMSCRVMGRSVEIEIMSIIKHYLSKSGIRKITAEYIKTAKNEPVKDLFDKLGFNMTSTSGDIKMYETDISCLPESTGFFKEIINL